VLPVEDAAVTGTLDAETATARLVVERKRPNPPVSFSLFPSLPTLDVRSQGAAAGVPYLSPLAIVTLGPSALRFFGLLYTIVQLTRRHASAEIGPFWCIACD
jgi:hypothetical protein